MKCWHGLIQKGSPFHNQSKRNPKRTDPPDETSWCFYGARELLEFEDELVMATGFNYSQPLLKLLNSALSVTTKKGGNFTTRGTFSTKDIIQELQ